MPTKAFENGARWQAASSSIKQQSNGPDSALNGHDRDNVYLQSDLFKTISVNGESQAAAMQGITRAEALAKIDQRGSSSASEDHASPFSQHQPGSVRIESADDAEKPLAPLSNETLKNLSCSTGEETIASLTAKVPPSAPLLLNL